jgi:glycosyltransferase involved in cell wall biosynthesis
MRISIVAGFFLPVPPLKGGATEKIWYGLARIFASAGHSVTLVSRRWPGLPNDETAEGVRHLRLPGFDHTRRLPLNLLLDLAWGLRVGRALPPGDVVVCNTITLPVWLHRFRPDAGRVTVMIGRTPKGQVRFYGGVARIYAPSSFVAEQIAAEGGAARIQVTGYPIDWALHAGSARQAPPPITLGYVGRLHPEKGIALLVRAAGRLAARPDLPPWRLRIVGPSGIREGGGGGDWLKSLQAEAALSLGGRIEWLPPEFDPARLAAIYGKMDVFCYPSLAERGETFGVSVAEAMAAGCAAVVSGLECFRDIVSDGVTGLVFDHAAAEAVQLLSDCLARLIGEAGLRREIAGRGQEHVRRFDYAQVSREILADLALLAGTGA